MDRGTNFQASSKPPVSPPLDFTTRRGCGNDQRAVDAARQGVLQAGPSLWPRAPILPGAALGRVTVPPKNNIIKNKNLNMRFEN